MRESLPTFGNISKNGGSGINKNNIKVSNND
jgi:hypothetical protein